MTTPEALQDVSTWFNMSHDPWLTFPPTPIYEANSIENHQWIYAMTCHLQAQELISIFSSYVTDNETSGSLDSRPPEAWNSASEKGTGSRARPYFHSCHGTHGSLGPNTPKPRAEKSWGKLPWIRTNKATWHLHGINHVQSEQQHHYFQPCHDQNPNLFPKVKALLLCRQKL